MTEVDDHLTRIHVVSTFMLNLFTDELLRRTSKNPVLDKVNASMDGLSATMVSDCVAIVDCMVTAFLHPGKYHVHVFVHN